MSIEEHGREIGDHVRAMKQARQEALAALHPPCPEDSLPGTYVGLIGAFSTARLTFVCPNGDAFTYNRETGQEWLIPPDDKKFIRPDTLDLLEGNEHLEPGDMPPSSNA